MSEQWKKESYQSGTQVVIRNRIVEPWYHIGHLAADTEADGGRYDVSGELEAWLNFGPEPWWMELLQRLDADNARTPHGCTITATGPMYDDAEPPQWGLWKTDDSSDARIARGLFIDALIKRDRALIPAPAATTL